MANMILTLLVGLAGALLTPLAVGTLIQGTLNQMERRRVNARIKANKLFRVGAVFSRVELHGHPAPLMGRCKIVQIKVGQVIFESLDGKKELLPVTGKEFETIWPVVEYNSSDPFHQF